LFLPDDKNAYDVTMSLTSKALYSKDVFKFAIHNETKNICPAVNLDGSIFYTNYFNLIDSSSLFMVDQAFLILVAEANFENYKFIFILL